MIANILLNLWSDYYLMEKETGDRRHYAPVMGGPLWGKAKDFSAVGLSWSESAGQAGGGPFFVAYQTLVGGQ